MTKCIICDKRPAHDGGYCITCTSKLDAERKRKGTTQPIKFLTYRGYVVGLYSNGNGRLVPKLLTRNPDTLPKAKTFDLNTYIEGFTRDQIKAFKRCVLQLACAA